MSTPENNPDKAAKVFADDRAYVFHSWSAQGQITPMTVAGGAGSYFWDFNGKKYLDFSCQLVFTNIGHQHPKVIAAIKEQADVLATVAPQHANEARNEAAKRITGVAGDSFKKVFFTNGGADGVENAIRMARLHTNKHKVLSTYRSIMAIPALRLMQQVIQEDFQMSLVMDMCTSGVHIFIAQLFGQLIRKRSASEHLSI